MGAGGILLFVEIIHVRFGVMSDGFAMSEIGPLTAEVDARSKSTLMGRLCCQTILDARTSNVDSKICLPRFELLRASCSLRSFATQSAKSEHCGCQKIRTVHAPVNECWRSAIRRAEPWGHLSSRLSPFSSHLAV